MNLTPLRGLLLNILTALSLAGTITVAVAAPSPDTDKPATDNGPVLLHDLFANDWFSVYLDNVSAYGSRYYYPATLEITETNCPSERIPLDSLSIAATNREELLSFRKTQAVLYLNSFEDRLRLMKTWSEVWQLTYAQRVELIRQTFRTHIQEIQDVEKINFRRRNLGKPGVNQFELRRAVLARSNLIEQAFTDAKVVQPNEPVIHSVGGSLGEYNFETKSFVLKFPVKSEGATEDGSIYWCNMGGVAYDQGVFKHAVYLLMPTNIIDKVFSLQVPEDQAEKFQAGTKAIVAYFRGTLFLNKEGLERLEQRGLPLWRDEEGVPRLVPVLKPNAIRMYQVTKSNEWIRISAKP